MDLKNSVAIVTGGNGGLGQRICLALAAAGANIAVVYAQSASEAERVAGEIGAHGAEAAAFACDVTQPAQVGRLVDHVTKRFGRLDILINDAAYNKSIPFDDLDGMTIAEWSKILDVNLTGPFHCIKAVAPVMRKQGRGRIVNIASIAGKGYAGTSNAIYAASKGSVISLTRTAAQQLARYDINVNAICPGITVTALSEANVSVRARDEGLSVEEMTRRRNAVIPLGRPNDPEDVAAVAVFLASPAARNITGQSLNVDGGIVFD
jgi:3-oxoacyl-[acyl-carrier protein] reductase